MVESNEVQGSLGIDQATASEENPVNNNTSSSIIPKVPKKGYKKAKAALWKGKIGRGAGKTMVGEFDTDC